MGRFLQRITAISAASALTAALALYASRVPANGAADAALGQAVRRALLATTPAKIMIAEFYMVNGRMPVTAEEAGLPQDAGDPTPVDIVSEGVIAVEIAPKGAAPRRHLFLLPKLSPRALSWKCISTDIPKIADLATGCAFDATYVPTRETPESLEAKANPGMIVLNIEGKRFRLHPEGVVSGSPSSAVGAAEVTGLSEAGRERLITVTLDRVAGRLDALDRLLNVTRWLAAMGPSVHPILDRRIGGEPLTGAAALLALCEVAPRPTLTGIANECVAALAARAPKAIERLHELATQQLRNPFDHPYYAERLFDCSGAVAVLAALGPRARPAADALGALLDDPRTQIETAGRNYCKPRDVAVTSLRILLTAPPDTAHAKLAEDALAALAHVVMFGPNEREPKAAQLGALLDARTELREPFSRRIGALANEWAQRCESISYQTPALITDLGVLGFDALQPILDRVGDDPGCETHSSMELRALAALLTAYPRLATGRYRLARSGYGRDAFITAALEIARDTDNARTKKLLDEFLVATGYAPIRVVPFQVSFPRNPKLYWTPHPDWTIFAGAKAAAIDLRAAYREFAVQWPDCAIPVDDESAWHSVERAKRLFVYSCGGNNEPWMAAIGSPEGFKRMQLPDWLGGQFDRDAIVGVSDVDEDGNLEVLLVLHCDGHDSACVEGEVPDTYELMEEDGDRFTHFRVGP